MKFLSWLIILSTFSFFQSYGQYNVGFRQINLPSGTSVAIWYPTKSTDSTYYYTKSFESRVALNSLVADSSLPVILFSHGFGGCSIQSVFITENLARHGYIVAAPDHKDASCTVNGEFNFRFMTPEVSFFEPQKWTDKTFVNRKNDIDSTISWILTNSEFSKKADSSRIGVMGHSLGGYTVFGLSGGWDSWYNKKIKCILLYSPYLTPFMVQKRADKLSIPIMFQGAEFDLVLTPQMRQKDGLFDAAQKPKYYIELKGGNHFEWSNLICTGKKNVSDCISDRKNAVLINLYTLAFFDKYLKEKDPELLKEKNKNIKDFRFR